MDVIPGQTEILTGICVARMPYMRGLTQAQALSG